MSDSRGAFERYRRETDDEVVEYGIERGRLVRVRGVAQPVLVIRRSGGGQVGLTFAPNCVLVQRTFPPSGESTIEVVDPPEFHVPGLVRLFRASVETNLDHAGITTETILTVTSGVDLHAMYLVAWAVEKSMPLFAAHVAATIRTTEAAMALLRSDVDLPLVVRVALLPMLDKDVAREVVDAAHSDHWTDAQGNNVAERLATAAAYVYADHTHRVVDDPHGRNVIRERRVVAELMRRGTMPWVSRMEHPEDHK